MAKITRYDIKRYQLLPLISLYIIHNENGLGFANQLHSRRSVAFMSFYGNKKLILLAALLGVLLIYMPQIARIGFALSEYLSDQPRINYALALTLTVFGFLGAYLQLTKHETLKVNRAIKAYLAFGFGIAGIYFLLYVSHPGCFSMPADISERGSIIDFIYFSFVTVTTVGYGDIVPRHTFVRFIVLLQVLFGILLVLRISILRK